jgi:hypothetical protein
MDDFNADEKLKGMVSLVNALALAMDCKRIERRVNRA